MAGGVASAVLGDRQLIHAVLPSYEPPPEWRPAKDRIVHPDYNNDLKKFLPRNMTLVRSRAMNSLGFNIRGDLGCGIYVSQVLHNSDAEQAGLQEGDQILSCNGTSFENTWHDEAVRILKSASEINLVVRYFPYGYQKTLEKTQIANRLGRPPVKLQQGPPSPNNHHPQQPEPQQSHLQPYHDGRYQQYEHQLQGTPEQLDHRSDQHQSMSDEYGSQYSNQYGRQSEDQERYSYEDAQASPEYFHKSEGDRYIQEAANQYSQRVNEYGDRYEPSSMERNDQRMGDQYDQRVDEQYDQRGRDQYDQGAGDPYDQRGGDQYDQRMGNQFDQRMGDDRVGDQYGHDRGDQYNRQQYEPQSRDQYNHESRDQYDRQQYDPQPQYNHGSGDQYSDRGDQYNPRGGDQYNLRLDTEQISNPRDSYGQRFEYDQPDSSRSNVNIDYSRHSYHSDY